MAKRKRTNGHSMVYRTLSLSHTNSL